MLPKAVATDAARLARFQREAEVLAALNHPHIAQIYGVEDGALVMELVNGPTLADRIAMGAMPLSDALPIARQIADALEAAHDKGIVHRDLKPGNVKITPDGIVKVLDFGLAKAIGPDGSTATSDLANSPTLTSPATRAGRDPRHGVIHVAGAGAGPRRRQARRHLGVRRRAVRDAERQAPLRWRNRDRDDRRGHQGPDEARAPAGRDTAGSAHADRALSRTRSEVETPRYWRGAYRSAKP